ncbi:MAG: hypothetical protein V4671_27625, partial [Armatimonadota bacterium]
MSRRANSVLISACVLTIALPVGTAVSAAPPPTFQQTLKTIRWNPERQGPLLIVDPAHVKLASAANKVAEANAEKVSLRTLTAYYDRKIVPVGSLTILAPTTMVVIGPPLGPPTPMGALEGADPLRYLLATLTQDQWQGITSDGGLPVSALSPQQSFWLDAIVPASQTLVTWDANAVRRRTLTPEERNQSRLRLSRDLLVSLMSKDGAPSTGRGFRGLALNRGTPAAPVYMSTTDDNEDAEKQTDAKDRKPVLRRVIPSVEKPGDIDLSSAGPGGALFSRPVSLEPDADGNLTLGMLVKRVAKVTRLELYADGRVSPLPIAVLAGSGATVRAGDLLRALCWGTTGTFRRVGSAEGLAAYILTDDRVGIGSRIARIVEWERAASILSDSVESNAQAAIKSANVGKLVKYASDDPFALPPPLMRDVFRLKKEGNDLSLPAELLPPAFRQFAEEEAKKAAADQKHPEVLRTDRIRVKPGLYLALLLPDGNTVRAREVMEDEVLNNALSPEEREPEIATPEAETGGAAPLRISLTEIPKPMILAVSASGAEEARALVQEARRYQFARIWLQTPPTRSGRDALAAAVVEGQAGPGVGAIPVWGAA